MYRATSKRMALFETLIPSSLNIVLVNQACFELQLESFFSVEAQVTMVTDVIVHINVFAPESVLMTTQFEGPTKFRVDLTSQECNAVSRRNARCSRGNASSALLLALIKLVKEFSVIERDVFRTTTLFASKPR